MKLDRDAFVWMEFNDRATGDAALLVGATSILLALGSGDSLLDLVNPFRLLGTILTGFILWLIYTGAVYAIERLLLDGHGTFATILRITGFAFPTLLLLLFTVRFLSFLPATVAVAAGGVWFVVIVAYGLMYTSDLSRDRAFMASVGGWVAYTILQAILVGIRIF